MNTEESAEIVNDDSNPELMPARRTEQSLSRATPAPMITAAQAKVDAIANLTMKAYERAATLALNPEEIARLQEDFPDEAFQPGAAGKENLIYIEHAYLRDRLNKVFGPGAWSIVPRSRWAEDFTTGRGAKGSRIYVEAMLIIRGCFVAEAIGAMEYYPSNDSQNYGDAVEGAKTAAFRRCAKELGVGLQAWKKEWCLDWWQRKRSQSRQAAGKTAEPKHVTPPPEKAPQKAPAKESAPKNTAPAPTAAPTAPNGMSPEDRTEFINILQGHANKAVKRGVEQLIRFLQTRRTAKGRLLLAQGQTLTDLADADLKAIVNGWNSVLAPFAEFAEMNPPPPIEDAPDFTDKATDDEAAPKGKGEPDWLAGAGQAVKDEPRNDQPDDPGDDTLQVEGFKVKGILQAVIVQEGTYQSGRNAGRMWTAYHCHVDGNKYTSFDKKTGEKAVGLKNKPVHIVFERTTKGNGVLSISAA